MVSSTLLEESEEESEADEEDIDFDKSIRIEASVNHMDRKRKFLEKYIKIKIIQLRDLLQSRRTLGYKFTDPKLKSPKGDKTNTDKNKVFSIQENDEEEAEELDEEMNECAEEECVFLFKNNDKVKSALIEKIVLLSRNK